MNCNICESLEYRRIMRLGKSHVTREALLYTVSDFPV